MGSERRKNKRFNFSGDYFFYPGNREYSFNCKLKNISVTGACMESSEDISKNEIIFLNIKGTRDIVLKSKVVWKIKKMYGLLFLLETEKDFEDISYVINYISNRIT